MLAQEPHFMIVTATGFGALMVMEELKVRACCRSLQPNTQKRGSKNDLKSLPVMHNHTTPLSTHPLHSVSQSEYVPLAWYSDYPNWGDALNPVLAGLLSGKPVRRVEVGEGDCYIAVGSILWMADSRTEVWGSGFMFEEDTLPEPPKCIHAVRGPLTRAVLLRQGIDCPEVYGDPALLLPLFYDPEVEPQYDVGLIPHILDKGHPWIERQRTHAGALVIDVQGDVWGFVRAVKACRTILSSSLHGLICADAYGVPNAWVQLSGQLPGGDFKFRDYRLSIGAGEKRAVLVDDNTPLDEVEAHVQAYPLRLDLERLLLACPFLSDELRRESTNGLHRIRKG
jgi:pyruvyltransferase